MPNHIHWLFHIQDKKMDAIWVLHTFKSYVATQTIKCLKYNESKEVVNTMSQGWNCNKKMDTELSLCGHFQFSEFFWRYITQ